MERRKFEEWLSAAATAGLAALGLVELKWEDYVAIEDKLVELLEEFCDAAKPAAEDTARKAGTED